MFVKIAIFGLMLFGIGALLSALDTDSFVLVYNKSNLTASIDINGYVIAPAGSGASASGQMELNLWLMPGLNSITVKFIKDGGTDAKPKLAFKIFKTQAGMFPDEGTKLLEYDAPLTGGATVFPSEKVVSFTPTATPPLALWEQAETITLTDADRVAITALLIRLNAVLDIGYGTELLRLLAFRNAESARSHWLDPVAEAPKTNELISAIIPLTRNKMEALPLTLDFRPLAGGKVFWVTDGQGGNPLRAKPDPDGGRIEIAAYVARIAGVWTLVR